MLKCILFKAEYKNVLKITNWILYIHHPIIKILWHCLIYFCYCYYYPYSILHDSLECLFTIVLVNINMSNENFLRSSAIPIKLPMVFFTELGQIISQFAWKYKKSLNSQIILEKEEWNWRNQPAWLQSLLQSHSHQDSMVLAQRQKYRSMEQDRKPRDKSMNLWTPYLW